MSAMVVLAGPAAAASSGRALMTDTSGPDAPPPPGQLLIPGMMGGKDSYGSLITAMLANQGGMIGEMASILHPALADPLASLANMMTIVQTTLPELMGGMGLPFEPSPLVHEMFVKYSNGTKTEADLAMIDKGLDELFSHDFTEDDKSKLVDFMDMKDVFNKKGEPLPGKDIDLPVKTPKEWPIITVRRHGERERERVKKMERGREAAGLRPRPANRLSGPAPTPALASAGVRATTTSAWPSASGPPAPSLAYRYPFHARIPLTSPPPSLFLHISLTFQPKNLVDLDVKTYKPEFPEKESDELDDKIAERAADRSAPVAFIKTKQDALQAELNAKVEPAKDIRVLKSNLTAIAKNFGAAYLNKTAPVKYTYSDAKIKGRAAVWTALYNKTDLGGLKNSTAEKAKWVPINLPKKSQNSLLQADELKFNLTKAAFPTNPGKDPLRPLIDMITSDPVGDRIAGVTPFLTFRDPVLGNVARSRTSVSTKVSTSGSDPSAIRVYDRDVKAKTAEGGVTKWTAPKGGYVGNTVGFQQSKVDLFNFGAAKFQYRPCIFAEGYAGLSVGAELLRIRPEGLAIGFDGVRSSPQLIDVSPVLIKVQAVGTQINPELINVEPILVSVSPKVNMAGKAVAKPWQLTKPPKFGPKPKEDKLTLAPYPKPHTSG